jgi:hypothetical protein
MATRQERYAARQATSAPARLPLVPFQSVILGGLPDGGGDLLSAHPVEVEVHRWPLQRGRLLRR